MEFSSIAFKLIYPNVDRREFDRFFFQNTGLAVSLEKKSPKAFLAWPKKDANPWADKFALKKLLKEVQIVKWSKNPSRLRVNQFVSLLLETFVKKL